MIATSGHRTDPRGNALHSAMAVSTACQVTNIKNGPVASKKERVKASSSDDIEFRLSKTVGFTWYCEWRKYVKLTENWWEENPTDSSNAGRPLHACV